MRRISLVLIILLACIICRGDIVPVAPQVTIAGSEGLINEPNGQIILIVTIEGEFDETSWSCNQTYGTITEIIKDELYLYQSYTNACTTEQIVSENFTFTAINHPEDYPNSQLPSSSASATVTIYTMDILPPTISKCENITNLTGMYNTRAHKVTLIDKNHVPWLFYCAYNYQNGKYSMNAVYFNDAEWTCSFSLEEPAGHFYTPHDAISIENNNQKYIYLLYLDDSLNSRTWKIVKLDISDDCLPYLSDWSNEALPSITESNGNMLYDLLYDGQTFYIGGSDGNNIYYRKLEGNQWTNPTLVASDIGDETRLKWTPATNGQIWASFTRYHWSYRNIWGRPYENGEWLEPGSQYEEQWTNNNQYYPASYASAMISDSMNHVWTAFRESLGPSYYPQHIKAQLIRKNIADTGHEHISLSNNNEGESYYIDPVLAYNKGKNNIFGFYARYITTDIPAPSPDIVSGEILMKTVPCDAEASIWDTAPFYRITASSMSKSDTISVSEEFSPYGLLCVNKRQMFSGGSYLGNLVTYRHKADISFDGLYGDIPETHDINIIPTISIADADQDTLVTITGDIQNDITDQPLYQLGSIALTTGIGLKTLYFQFADKWVNRSPVYIKKIYLRDHATNLFTSCFDNTEGLTIDKPFGISDYELRNGRLMCKLYGKAQVRCSINNTSIGLEDDIPYRLGFDMRAVTKDRDTPTSFDILLQFNKHPVGNYQYEQYRIFSDNSFQSVSMLRLKDFLSDPPPYPTPTPIPPSSNGRFHKTSSPLESYSENWVGNNIDWCRWHRIEATINPIGDKTYIHLYIDGRLLQEWTDNEPTLWENITSIDIIVGDFKDEVSTIKSIDIDNITLDNAFVSDGKADGVVCDKYQQFVNMDNFEKSCEYSSFVAPLDDKIMIFDSGSTETIEIIEPANLHDYNLNLTLRYDSAQLGRQEIWLRRNTSDYYINLPGQDGEYDLSHEYGYVISTEDGFENITVTRVFKNENAMDPPNGIDDSEEIITLKTIENYESGAPIRLRFSIHGSILEIYANGRLICSLLDDSEHGIKLGTTLMNSFGADLTISDFFIDTDYYFWSRKGNRFMYRGEEAVPVGFNISPCKYHYCGDLFDYLTKGTGECLTDLEDRMKTANEAGARVLRMIMVVGSFVIDDSWEAVDVPFAVYNDIKVAYWDTQNYTVVQKGKITYDNFAAFMTEVVKMARERDMVILPALRHGADSDLWIYHLTHPFNEPGGGLWHYDYVNNADNLTSRIAPMIQPFTDEPGIFAWEYFNEGPGNQWLWKDSNNNKICDIDEYQPKRIADFFTTCTQRLTDERIEEQSTVGSMADKHIFSSGIWSYTYAGWWHDRIIIDITRNTNPDKFHLLSQEAFMRYDDFIDWHAYGQDANIDDPTTPSIRSLKTDLDNFYSRGYNNETCPPIFFGEINPWKYENLNTSTVVSEFAGIRRTLKKPNNPKLSWYWYDPFPYFSYSIEYDTKFIPNIEIQSIDCDPSYLRLNEHYKIWKDWYDGIRGFNYRPSNPKDPNNKRKIGHGFWILKNYAGSFDQYFKNVTYNGSQFHIYDPANRTDGIHIDNYIDGTARRMSWHSIYLNEESIYSFYKQLFKKDWGIK